MSGETDMLGGGVIRPLKALPVYRAAGVATGIWELSGYALEFVGPTTDATFYMMTLWREERVENEQGHVTGTTFIPESGVWMPSCWQVMSGCCL